MTHNNMFRNLFVFCGHSLLEPDSAHSDDAQGDLLYSQGPHGKRTALARTKAAKRYGENLEGKKNEVKRSGKVDMSEKKREEEILGKILTHKRFKRTLIYYDTDTQSAKFRGSPPCQATKRHLSNS